MNDLMTKNLTKALLSRGNLKSIPLHGLVLSAALGFGIFGAHQVQASTLNGVEEVKKNITSTQSKTITVSGKVLDESGLSVIGARVSVVESPTIGASTDMDGNFSLKNVPIGATVEISFVGMKTQRIVVSDEKPLQITLTEDQELLDELIVVGYSVQRKESLTGSLQSISSKELKTATTPSVENLLSSKAPGVYVAPGSGRPGSTGAVVIRGKSTINGSTAPLWVIDGIIVGNSPGTLNPNDVETMTILKDAASTAVYGSQGANGVIVVTTKGAKAGDIKIDLSLQNSVTLLSKGNMRVMNGSELYDYYKSFSNADVINFPRWNDDLRNSNFDWWDFATQPGYIQSYNVNLSGGSEKISTVASLGVYDETGAVKGYDYTRYNFMLKTTYRPFEWLTINPYMSGSRTNTEDQQHSVGAMYSNLPWDSPYDEEGNIIGHRSSKWVNANSTNYIYDLQWNKGSYIGYDLSGNFDFEIKLAPWLTFSSVNNYKYGNNSSSYYEDPRSSSGESVSGRVSEYRSDFSRRYTNQILRFNKNFGKHYLNGILAYEFNDYKGRNLESFGTGLVAGFYTLNTTSIPERAKGTILEWAVQSFFTNVNYSYDDKYLAQVSLRRDGASNFGKNAQYGNFYSISGGWNIHKEEFFKNDIVNVMKLRAAYGSVGNRPNSLYPQYNLYSVQAKYNGVSGLLISQIGNDDLTWEKSYTTGIGLDMTFIDRISLSLDYYNKKTTDLLYAVPVSGLNGVTSVWKNVGSVLNRGFEATLNADIIRTDDWNWSVSANIGLNRNKVTELYGQKDPATGEVAPIIIGGGLGIAGEANRILKVGKDADTWYIPEWAGVDEKTGAPTWYTNKMVDGKLQKEVTTNYAQAEYIEMGSYTPDFFGGFSTSLRYKNVDLNAVFGYSVGGDIYNYTRSEYDSDGAYTDRNQMALMKGWSRWKSPGDKATHPLPSYNNKSNSNKTSSRFLEDGSFLKLRTLTLGYNISMEKYHISNLRVYLSGENLFTLTKYSGVDPELSPSNDGSVIGVTSAVYPSTRKFSLGINLTF